VIRDGMINGGNVGAEANVTITNDNKIEGILIGMSRQANDLRKRIIIEKISKVCRNGTGTICRNIKIAKYDKWVGNS
jgi:hypothetical protein